VFTIAFYYDTIDLYGMLPMKRLLLGEHREDILNTLDLTLKHWGYRVLAVPRRERLNKLIRDTAFDLLIINADWLDANHATLEALETCIGKGASLMVLKSRETTPQLPLPHQLLDVPVDIFSLFSAIQQHLEKHPRKNMRLALKLPGMICRHHQCQLGEVLSLSTRGLFMKTGFRLDQGERFRIVLPLMGMKEELELSGKVLYRVHPDPKNNYQQGVGVGFVDLQPNAARLLERYIKTCFREEMSHRRGHHGWHTGALTQGEEDTVLRLPAPMLWETPPAPPQPS